MEQSDLTVVVHHITAPEPFRDPRASRGETLGHLKSRVLLAFGLSDGPTGDGNQASHWLYHDKQRLQDLNQTLGDLAGDKHVLQLKLVLQITQGLG